MFNKNKKLKRNEIEIKLYKCRKKYRDSDAYSNIFINIVDKCLSNYAFESDDDFVIGSRKKFVYNEIFEVLDGIQKEDDPIYFALDSLFQFICNPDTISSSALDESKWKDGKIVDGKDLAEIRDKYDRYISKGYICLEEKYYIEDILNRIKMEKGIALSNEQLLQYLDNPIAPSDRKTNMIDKFLETDDNEKYLYLKFRDYDGKKYNFVGKNIMKLTLDEIIALKKYSSYLYEKALKMYDKKQEES